MLQDLRLAFRSLCRTPFFAAALIGILALGIGATTAMFSVVHGVLLKPLPLYKSEQLVLFGGSVTARPGERDRLAYWSQSHSLIGVAEIGSIGGISLGLPGSATYVPATEVSANFFAVFQEAPLEGRGFLPREERPGENAVAVLSHGLWQREFGGDPGIIGRTIRVNGEPFTVVGVTKPDFSFPSGVEFWIPRNAQTYASRVGEPEGTKAVNETFGWRLIGRRTEGATLEKAQAEIALMAAEMTELQKQANLGIAGGTHLIRLDRWSAGRFRTAVLALLAGAGFVLLIATGNAANLLLARSVARQKEVAIRLCLGANRWRIARQRLSESFLLALGGCTAGLAIALWSVAAIRTVGPPDLFRLREVSVDSVALLFAVLVSLVTAVLANLGPVAQAAPDLTTAMNQAGAATSAGGRLARRARQALVVTEVGLACALLIAASMMIASFFKLTALDPGFDAAGVTTFSLSLPAVKYDLPEPVSSGASSREAEQDWRDLPTPKPGSSHSGELRVSFQRRLLEALQAVPGVESAGVIAKLPVADSFGMVWVGPSDERGTLATIHNVGGEYLQAMGIPLLAGRYLDKHDIARGDGVVISESLANKFWPRRSPVGDQLEISWRGKQFREVVGVVRDTAVDRLDDYYRARLQFYLPDEALRDFTVVMRVRGQLGNFENVAKQVVRSLDSDVSVFRVHSMEEVIGQSVREQKFRGQVLGTFAGVAVFLALLGVAAVMAHAVATRTHEMGVRMALGAERSDLLRMVLVESTKMTLAGASAGLLCAWWLSRYIDSLLYGVSATDPWIYAGAAVVLVVGGSLAALLPALRASRVDPTVALRYE